MTSKPPEKTPRLPLRPMILPDDLGGFYWLYCGPTGDHLLDKKRYETAEEAEAAGWSYFKIHLKHENS